MPLRPHRRSRRVAVSITVATAGLYAATASADLYWDTTGTFAGAGSPTPNGTWSAAFANWTTDATGSSTTTTWTPGETAVFSAGSDATGSYLIRLADSVPVPVAGIRILNGTVTFSSTNGTSLLLSGNASIDVDAGQTGVINVPVATVAGLTKSGGGTLTLSANNTLSPPANGACLTITDGTVESTTDSNTAGQSSRTGTVPAAAISNYLTLNGGAFRETGTGSSLATFLAANKGIYLAPAGGTLDVADSTTTTTHAYRGVISGPGSLTKAGPGVLGLSLPQTYVGATTVSAGTLRLRTDSSTPGQSGSLPAGTALTVAAGATFDMATSDTTLGSLAGAGTVVATRSNAPTLTFGSNGTSTTFSGVMTPLSSGQSVPLTINKVGPGTTTVAGSNWLNSGPTTISAGTLRLAGSGGLGDASPLTIAAGATFDLNGISDTIASLAGNGSVTGGHGALATLTVGVPTTAAATTFAGTMSGNLQLIKSGTALLTLSSPNSYTGGTTLTANAKLSIGCDNALPATTTLTFTTGGTFDLANASGSAFSQTLAAVVQVGGIGTGVITNSGSPTRTLTIASGAPSELVHTAGDVSFRDNLRLNLTGATTLSMAGTNNTFTGGLVVTGRTVITDSDANLGAVPATPTPANVTLDGATLQLASGYTLHANRGIQLSVAGATVDAAAAGASTFASAISGPGAITKSGTGAVAFTGTNSYSGTTTIAGGVLSIQSDSNLGGGGVLLTGGTLATDAPATIAHPISLAGPGGGFDTKSFNSTLTGAISGTGTLIKSGAGTLKVGGIDAGGLSVTLGTVALAAPSSRIGTLSIAAAKLDIGSSRVILRTTTESALRAALASAQGASRDWTGNGLTSSVAKNNPTKSVGIAWGTPTEFGVGSWGGTAVVATDVLLKPAYYGDLNSDGVVTADDYVRMDRAVAKHLPARWFNGDFNYSGTVDGADYLLMDVAFAAHGGALSSDFLATREAQFGAAYVAALLGSVPEPGIATPLLLLALALPRNQRVRVRAVT